jgi:hypothetical protein
MLQQKQPLNKPHFLQEQPALNQRLLSHNLNKHNNEPKHGFEIFSRPVRHEAIPIRT